MKSDKNEKITFCWMKQDGKKIEKDPEFPLPTKIEVGKNKVVYNWTETNKVIDLIMEKINSLDYVKTDAPAVPDQHHEEIEKGLPEDDLPFLENIKTGILRMFLRIICLIFGMARE